MITVCLHGAESTGKSVLAAKLAAEFGGDWVPEYGRAYCEEHGTELTMADLLAIGAGHAQIISAALATRPPLLLLDTDQLMTAAWAAMLFDQVPAALLAYQKADLYLLFTPDVPWVDDGTRLFGQAAQRRRFADLAQAMLVRAQVPYQIIAGAWHEREAAARAAIAQTLAAPKLSPAVTPQVP